jgi:hypothetical protein
MFPSSEVNVLISYAMRDSDFSEMMWKYRDKISSLILDSGAFTKNIAKNKETADAIDIQGFKAFCLANNNKNCFDFIFNFDEDFSDHGFEANYRNQLELLDAGINVVPVVHDYLEETAEVDVYLKEKYPIIALGYSKKNKTSKNIISVSKKIQEAGLQVHLLGKSSYSELRKYRNIDYNDSSNWAQAVRYGYIYYWNKHRIAGKEEDRIRFKDKQWKSKEDIPYFEEYENRQKLEQYLKNELGITYKKLYGHNAHFYRSLVNAHYYVNLQDRLRDIFSKEFDVTLKTKMSK